MASLAISAVIGLIDLANKIRETAIQKAEWSREDEQAYRDRVKKSYLEPHWQVSGRQPPPPPPTDPAEVA